MEPATQRRRRPDGSRPNPIDRSLGRYLDTGFRPDIEGMRALAVVVVVLYHAHFFGLTGGFIGVDVFFVLSGFLITRLVLGELARTGTLSLGAFWARRARRLLPASALVAVVTAIAAHQILPPLTQRNVAADVVAAGTFTSNFVFAGRLGGYFGAQLGASTPSPLLHFWSLAVEEQFYLVWPPLLLLLTRRPRQYRRLLFGTIAVLGGASVLFAIWLTPRSPTWAFFLLPTRMGELLAGAFLAVLGTQVLRVAPPLRAGLGWAGLGMIAIAAFTFDESMPWPGSAALVPVLATMAVIVGGSATRLPWAPVHLLGQPALQWIGRHSYALYLWHWPVLVLAEAANGGPLSVTERVLAIGLAVGLSFLSLRLVEDPVRHARPLAAVPGRSLLLGACLLLAIVVTGTWVRAAIPALDGGEEAATPQLASVEVVPTSPADTLGVETTVAAPVSSTVAAEGASASTPTAPTTTITAATTPPTTVAATSTTVAALVSPDPPTGEMAQLVGSMQQLLTTAVAPAPVPSNLRPSLGTARDRALPYTQGCVNVGVNARLQPCDFGVSGGARTIVLYGDSHAVQWFEPLQQIALARGDRLVLLAKGGCPVTDVVVPTPVLRHTCPPYRDAAIDWIEREQPDLVIVSNSYTQYADDADTWAAGADTTIARLAAVASNLVVIGDNPAAGEDPPACLSAHTDDASACVTPRADAVRVDRISGELAAARAHDALYIDTTDWFCTPTSCPVVIGDLLVLRDETHLTPPMAEFLTPILQAALAPAFAEM
ncbi:MAG: acyltransferase family protein [Desertimonas sp.]